MKTPGRILVVVTLRIGDVLLATPLLRSLRRAWPDARLDVLVFEHTEGVLKANPDIDRIITVPARPGFWAHLRLIASLFRRYDLAMTGLLGDRPTLYAWIAGKTRFGMQDGSGKERWKQRFLSRWAVFDRVNTHTVLTNLGLVDLMGIPRSYEVVAAWSTEDERAIRRLLQFDFDSEPFAVLHVSPKFAYKTWHPAGWVAVSQWLQSQGMHVVLTGSDAPDELAYVGGIYDALPQGVLNMAGKFSLSESACLLHRARCYVGPDTALTHMAAAVGTPTVALFGPSNLVKWGPWPKGYGENRNPYRMKGTQRVHNVVVVQGEGECVPCMEEGCDRHNDSLSKCLQELPATRVIAALREVMAETEACG